MRQMAWATRHKTSEVLKFEEQRNNHTNSTDLETTPFPQCKFFTAAGTHVSQSAVDRSAEWTEEINQSESSVTLMQMNEK